jgi:hypothetical protein
MLLNRRVIECSGVFAGLAPDIEHGIATAKVTFFLTFAHTPSLY